MARTTLHDCSCSARAAVLVTQLAYCVNHVYREVKPTTGELLSGVCCSSRWHGCTHGGQLITKKQKSPEFYTFTTISRECSIWLPRLQNVLTFPGYSGRWARYYSSRKVYFTHIGR